MLGMSYSWWVDKHNAHHSNPNQFDMDPDIDIPLLAFSQEQALSRRGIARLIVKYQTWLFFPMLTLSSISIRGASLRFLYIYRQAKKPVLETGLMLTHIVVGLGFVFYLYGFWAGLLFVVVQQALFGLYMASVFAPNHKGMMTLDKDEKMDFLRQQVLTARNVKASPFIDFWYGGLNYQIEHHLYPNMPRNKLRESQIITMAFCKEHNISYHETSMFQSYVEILESVENTDNQAEDSQIVSELEVGSSSVESSSPQSLPPRRDLGR
jgi:fatty acid desaturase